MISLSFKYYRGVRGECGKIFGERRDRSDGSYLRLVLECFKKEVCVVGFE